MERENAPESAANKQPGGAEAEGEHSASAPRPTPMGQGPTVLTWNDLLDIPRQILPEQTYIHLQNAGREAALAVFSLLKSIDASRREAEGGKVRKHIEVE